MSAVDDLMSWQFLLLGILVGLAAGVKEEAPFDLFLLVRSYSPGYCKTAECTVAPV